LSDNAKKEKPELTRDCAACADCLKSKFMRFYHHKKHSPTEDFHPCSPC
jgi:hypothetical protein